MSLIRSRYTPNGWPISETWLHAIADAESSAESGAPRVRARHWSLSAYVKQNVKKVVSSISRFEEAVAHYADCIASAASSAATSTHPRRAKSAGELLQHRRLGGERHRWSSTPTDAGAHLLREQTAESVAAIDAHPLTWRQIRMLAATRKKLATEWIGGSRSCATDPNSRHAATQGCGVSTPVPPSSPVFSSPLLSVVKNLIYVDAASGRAAR